MICEFQTLIESLRHELSSGPMPKGTWISGNKHRITQKTMEKGGESGDIEVICMLLMRPGKKGHVVCGTDPTCTGKSCIVTAEFDKSMGCTGAAAKQVCIEFAAWLKSEAVDEQVQE